MKKNVHIQISIVLACISAALLVLLTCLNPNRASLNHAVFEGGRPNPITNNQQIMDSIIETDRKTYQNENDPRILRRNYILFSIYDVQVSSSKTYHILGFLQTFRLINS
ncbi:MAG TPA: hypothetical protein VHP31_07380 [Caproicibacter sp.]|nr:hypothetical protein [Caproicibacter sp.]